MDALLRWSLIAQGLLYVVTGAWGVLHRRSFEAVTGAKTDYWLVRMVGLLAVVIGAAILYAVNAWTDTARIGPLAVLSLGSAAAFATVDIVFGVPGRISRIYLGDAAAEIVLLALVCVGVARASRAPAPSAARTGVAESPLAPEPRDSSDAARATAMLQGYYTALDARDFARAFAAWGSGGPPGDPSLSEFSARYAGVDSIRVSPGAPGPVEGAAGSRYVSIPVTVRLWKPATAQTDTGSAVLRRTVVPGAPPSDQRWHLYRETLAVSH